MGTCSLTLPHPLLSQSRQQSSNPKVHELWLSLHNTASVAMAAAAAGSAGVTATAARDSVKPTSRLNSPPPHHSPPPSLVVSPNEPQAQPGCTRRQASSLLLSPILLSLSSTSAALLGGGLVGSPAGMAAGASEEGRRGPAFQEVDGGVRVLDVRVGTGAAPEMGERVRRKGEGG